MIVILRRFHLIDLEGMLIPCCLLLSWHIVNIFLFSYQFKFYIILINILKFFFLNGNKFDFLVIAFSNHAKHIHNIHDCTWTDFYHICIQLFIFLVFVNNWCADFTNDNVTHTIKNITEWICRYFEGRIIAFNLLLRSLFSYF